MTYRIIQLGQEAELNPDLKIDPMIGQPYPYTVDETGAVQDQEFWRGEPSVLIGFQDERDVQTVNLLASAWFAHAPETAVGKYAVFVANGQFYTDKRPVVSIKEY